MAKHFPVASTLETTLEDFIDCLEGAWSVLVDEAKDRCQKLRSHHRNASKGKITIVVDTCR